MIIRVYENFTLFDLKYFIQKKKKTVTQISGDYGLSIDDNIKSGDGFLLHVQEEGVINL